MFLYVQKYLKRVGGACISFRCSLDNGEPPPGSGAGMYRAIVSVAIAKKTTTTTKTTKEEHVFQNKIAPKMSLFLV